MSDPIRITARLRNGFWRRVDKTGDCWIWTGAANAAGYGRAAATRSSGARIESRAHRLSYILTHGADALPEGADIDHLCRVRLCVNPAHLEVVSRSENVRRARPYEPMCPAGTGVEVIYLVGGDRYKIRWRTYGEGGEVVHRARTFDTREQADAYKEALRAQNWPAAVT